MAKLARPDESLMDAIRRGESGEVKRLLLSGANANAVDEQGRTPLLLAVTASMTTYRRREILADLLKYKADARYADAAGMTALHEAAARSDAETARTLAANGADVNARAKDGATPLHAAMKAALGTGKTETMQALIDYGANSLLRDARGKTPLEGAREKEGFAMFYASVIGFLADWERDKPAYRRNQDYDAANQNEQKTAAQDTMKKLQDRARQQKNKFKL